MRSFKVGLFASVVSVLALAACGGGGNNPDGALQSECSDGEDNDGDGTIDFPDDLGCISAADTSENSPTSAKCSDGRDNDDDGRTDYPSDPGCFAPQADDETDDCPSGPDCPQCADGQDNDDNGATDYPADPGCTAAADDDEFLSNPQACGPSMTILQIPTSGMIAGNLDGSSTSTIMSPCGGGGGSSAYAYQLRLQTAAVVEISTDDVATDADTVIQIRGEMCSQPAAHLACSDDIASDNQASFVTASLQPGTYYIVIGGHDASSIGQFVATIKTYAGEGAACMMDSQCGPGLVCRTPLGGAATVCAPPRCADTDDEDGDGLDGFPTDPGCTSLADNDEADDCPSGPNCPECADGVDNDNDSGTDYPNDTTCTAAGNASESCVASEGVALITGPQTTDTTTGAVDDVRPSCLGGSLTHTAPDKTYRLDVPQLASLTLDHTGFDEMLSLYNSTCGGTPLQCADFPPFTLTNVAAGTYYVVVDGYDDDNGAFTLTVNGQIANNASCETPLFESGALACGPGYACKGAAGSRICGPALCGDGVDNDSDGKTDYPFDPGCESVADDTEADPATLPVCGDGQDNEPDGLTDYPADYGCTAASGTSEVFCTGEADPTSLITSAIVAGATTMKANNFASTSCQSSASGPDVAYALALPVPVASLTVQTITPTAMGTTSFDTILTLRDATCGTQLRCDDDGGDGLLSLLSLTNVAPGNYAIVVDGYSGAAGDFELEIRGTVAPNTLCDSPLFSGGANAMLSCPTGTTCGGSPARCQ